MKRNKLILSAALLSAIVISSAFKGSEIETRIYSGTAFKAGSSMALYTENYTEQVNSEGRYKSIFTEYRDMKGKILCSRSLKFNKSRYAPDYTFENHISGYSEGVEVKGSSIRVYHQHKKGGETEDKWMDLPANTVVDGGFNLFIKDHWPEIEKGASISFTFVSPIHLTTYKLKIRKGKAETINGKPSTLVYLEPDNFILAKLIAPVKCYYEPKSQRLQSYEGITNIQNVFEGLKNVRIVYPNLGP